MSLSFIHLSDIHFGQEKGAQLVINNDVKECLLQDVDSLLRRHADGKATGIIVTGDIAYAGKRKQYADAGEWLDRLVGVAGCKRNAVQVVPGNHDIDRELISHGCQLMLDQIIQHGQPKLDEFLENKLDRESIYARFAGYRPFAEAYNCPLDRAGGGAGDRRFDIAPNRSLRFIGLNSALICSGGDVEGKLILGARQRVLPRNPGEELVVLCHHPLHWLQDSEDARRYVRTRARVFVSGHEHDPSLKSEKISEGCDLLMLAAGATVPPNADAKFTYTYNLLIFEWDEASDGLKLRIIPRAWDADNTCFVEDGIRLGGPEVEVILGCPNFRSGLAPARVHKGVPTREQAAANKAAEEKATKALQVDDAFGLLLLRFFRDLTPAQRIEALVSLKALPEDWRDPLTLTMERHVIDQLATSGRMHELEATIDKIQAQKS